MLRAADDGAGSGALRRRPDGGAGDRRTTRYTRFYPNEPDEYREPDCANGGPLDLRPTDPVWP